MKARGSEGRSRRRAGCWVLGAVLGLIGVTAAVTVAVAYRQMRAERRETRSTVQPLPEAPPSPERAGEATDAAETPEAARIDLDLSVAQLIVVPAAAGEPIRVEADYDPRSYELDQTTEGPTAGGWTYRIRFRPRGSSAMALLRLKLGDRPPSLRIGMPRDVPLTLEGHFEGAFAALELGGLWLETVDFEVDGGAVDLSLLEPLHAPMERFEVTGDKGSLEVTGLGNASPRTADFRQHLGQLDLDLRGAWTRDAEIRLGAYLAGGSVWLPTDVAVEGADELPIPRLPGTEELPGPRLHLSTSEHAGRLVFVR